MKKIKRILRIIAFVFLIILACTGMGLTGAAPVSSSKRQQLPDEVHVEMIEENEEEENEEEQAIS